MEKYEVYTRIEGIVNVVREFDNAREAYDFARNMKRTTGITTYVRVKGNYHFMVSF